MFNVQDEISRLFVGAGASALRRVLPRLLEPQISLIRIEKANAQRGRIPAVGGEQIP